MIITAQSIIEGAYGLLGIFDGTSALTPSEYQTGLTVLNDMIDSWNNLNLMVFSSTAFVLPFISGVQTYQIGQTNPFVFNLTGSTMTIISGTPNINLGSSVLVAPGVPPLVTVNASLGGGQYTVSYTAPFALTGVTGGLCNLTTNLTPWTNGQAFNWNFPRPTRIERVSIQFPSNTSQPVEIAIPFVDEEAWQGIPLKNTISDYPTMCYQDDAFPYNNLNFWPIPSTGASAVLYVWELTPGAINLQTQMEVPQGYNVALKQNLAIELAPYNQIEPAQTLLRLAAASRQAIDNINAKIPRVHYDPMWLGQRSDSTALNSRGRVVF